MIAPNRGFGQVDTSGLTLANTATPVPSVASLPVVSSSELSAEQSMENLIGQATVTTGTQSSTNWALIAAAGLFLILFIPLAMSGGKR